MWTWPGIAAVGKYRLRPFDHPVDRPDPKSWSTATLTSKKRPDVRQDGIGKVEYRLEGPETKYADRKGSGKPFGSG